MSEGEQPLAVDRSGDVPKLSREYKVRLSAVIQCQHVCGREFGGGHESRPQASGRRARFPRRHPYLRDEPSRNRSVLGVSATAALIKGSNARVNGLWVLGSTVWHAFVLGPPRAEVMGLIGVLALAVNVASVLILIKHKDGDANVRSVWSALAMTR